VDAAQADSTRALFTYEVRRDGRVIATLEAHQSDGGTTVETEVFPLAGTRREHGVTRPFTFGSPDQARRFADEAIIVFEYLNCTVT
jgi:hypothetical protein